MITLGNHYLISTQTPQCVEERRNRLSYKVAVLGTAGHFGLPLALVLAESGNDTLSRGATGAVVEENSAGFTPFFEEDADAMLKRCLQSGKLTGEGCLRDKASAVHNRGIQWLDIHDPGLRLQQHVLEQSD